MTEQRKATDILLDLEYKVDNLIKVISVYDLNTKLILDRVNKILNILEKSQNNSINKPIDNSIIKPVDIEIPKNEATVFVPSQQKIKVNDTPVVRVQRQTNDKFSEFSKPQDMNKKTPIMQLVKDSNGKVILMADIQIFDEKNELVAKAKTNATGKWQAHLKPGNYNVNIIKTDAASKREYRINNKIFVENSDTVMQLQDVIINKG